MIDKNELKRLAEAFPDDLDWDSNTEPFFNGPSGESLGGGPTGYYCVYGAPFEIDGDQYDGHTYVDTCKVDFAKFMVAAREGVLTLLTEIDQIKAENEKLKEACERADAIICSESKDAALERGRGNLLETKIEKLKVENEALRKDAERYRWLRSNEFDIGSYHPEGAHNHKSWFEHFSGESIDRAILEEREFADSAMSKGDKA